ncbi:rheacalcin-1-like [Spinachia spinachia]
MKTVLIFAVIGCVAVSIRADTVVPVEAAIVQQDNNPPPKAGSDADVASGSEARFHFCLDGWLGFRGNCYYLVNHFDTWSNAERFCASFDGSLASANNIWEYQFLQQVARTGGHTLAWLGGYFFEGNWRWGDGSVFNYHNWDKESSTDIFQCLKLNSQAGWSNHGCSTRSPFICQVKPTC